jgi:hypothetical protein
VAFLLRYGCPVTILAWRARDSQRRLATQARRPGSYAGRARFQPLYPELLPTILQQAIGKIVEVGFARVASDDDAFPGQELYLEWCRDDVFDGFEIPARDLDFLGRD